MNAPQTFPADAAPSDLHVRLMMSAALNGQFDGLPLTLFTKLDWIDAAQWLADVDGEPMDEAQAVAEIELMLAKSDYFDRWQHLPEARQNAWAGCFESYFDAQTEANHARAHLAALPAERRHQLNQEWDAALDDYRRIG